MISFSFRLLSFQLSAVVRTVLASTAEESFYNSIDHSPVSYEVHHPEHEVLHHTPDHIHPPISHETIETLPDKHHPEHHLHHTECALILNANKQYINEYGNFPITG